MQLGTPERGFSFQFDAPLDMRMTQTGERAYDIINSLSEDSLADIIFYFGEERRSRKIAKAIVNKRKIKKIKTTFDLNEIILSVKKANNKKIHPATKTFQALRIYINNELKDLYEALISIEKVLSEKGRLVVISFHSLEDRIVKNFIKENPNTILVDAGDFLTMSQQTLKDSLVAEAYGLLPYDALLYGDQELVLDARTLNRLRGQLGTTLVGTNIDRSDLFTSKIIRRKGLRIAVMGIVDSNAIKFYPEEIKGRIRLSDPVKAVKDEMKKLEKKLMLQEIKI